MRRLAAAMAGVGLCAWLLAQQAVRPRPLSEVVPAGALLYLEANNAGALLGEWNGSARKSEWLKSAHYQTFLRSRLFLRLDQVYQEYAAATGVPPDVNLLNSVAGGESALAVYDPNKLEFLYITRLPSARAMQGLLWAARERFSRRQAGGAPYYVKTAAAAGRTACFAVAGDLMLVATKEDALAGALTLLANGGATPVGREAWFQDAVAAAGPRGEVRMVANLARLAATPAFRSYWIQRNGAELREFRAAVSDLFRGGEVREERVLLRTDAGVARDAAAIGALLAMTPANAGLYRAWAGPDAGQVEALIRQKILNPGPGGLASSTMAPGVSLEAPEAGSAADLETRLDEAIAMPDGAVYRAGPLRQMLASATLRAALLVQSGKTLGGGVFAGNDAAVAIEGQGAWNLEAVRLAVQQALEGLYTTGNLGLVWRERNGVWETGGLASVAMGVRGSTLILGTQPELVRAMREQNGVAPAPATYAAAVRFRDELPHYERMMRLIDAPGRAPNNNEPSFFSESMASLVRTLLRAETASVRELDSGSMVKQTVRYQRTP